MTNGIIEERSRFGRGATPSVAEAGRLRRLGRDFCGKVCPKGGI